MPRYWQLNPHEQENDMADVVKLNPGNGALEAIGRYLKAFPDLILHTEVDDASHFLAWLWQEGFKVVPLDGTEAQ
jgi:hypothetical protein